MDDHGLPGRCLFGRCFRFWEGGIFAVLAQALVRACPESIRKRENASLARPARCVLLFFQEQIQGPENAPIARFDGLCCYQRCSEKNEDFRAWAWRGEPVCGVVLNGFYAQGQAGVLPLGRLAGGACSFHVLAVLSAFSAFSGQVSGRRSRRPCRAMRAMAGRPGGR